MPHKKAAFLLIDDDPDFLASLETVLRLALDDAKVLCETHPSSALRLLESHRIDIVVVDLRLPQMSGLDFARRVKAASPRTRTVILTGFPGQLLREFVGHGPSAMRAVDLCLAKTQQVDELVERITALLEEPPKPPSIFPDLDRMGRSPPAQA